jgi:threonine aldolase
LEADECGAPEFFSNGSKVLLLDGDQGKICPASIEEAVMKRTDLHYPKPKAVSVTQATEVGTTYTLDELQLIGETCRKRGLKFHMDGARFANAVVESGVTPAKMISEADVDILCFGSTKNGAMVGDAVVFFVRQLAYEFEYRCKKAGQLASKMRYLSAPWVALLKDDLWLKNARASNKRAEQLYQKVQGINLLRVLFPRQANSVFIELPVLVQEKLKERGWRFYTFIGKGGCRFMSSWDTTEEDVLNLVTDLREVSEA